ncbi:N-acyl-D-amino-acid deacylase family protein [Pontibacter harenae]|uniref:N-acyl-D-amino-acid deacylase family protein n=1 Tax=Pontibacter harenae TaxID=2894083 RepID=UPI001E290578|nr:amidohydrolase family protein [Pontibacter harenae]MCC9167296.1 amidohydrolase family protein [Pontibacter harenae]
MINFTRFLLKATTALVCAALVSSCQNVQNNASADADAVAYDILIQKATVIDGTGDKAYVANILLSGDSIALIERDTSRHHTALRIINAEGMVLTPGFIDAHAHGDPLQTPAFENFLAMGITTICLGQDGFSPKQPRLQSLIDSVNAVKPGVNIAMFAGHNTLRLLSGAGYEAVPTAKHMAAMEDLLANAMEDGCYGLTTGLEYTPGLYAESAELHSLAKVVGERNGLVMSHMRNEDDALVETSIRELLEQGKYSPVQISHIKVVYGKGEKRAQEILALLDSARAAGIQVTADFYPYTASYTGIEILFPEWAKKPNDFQQVLRTRRNELAEFLRNKIKQRNGPEATLIGSGPYKGKTLAQVADELNKPFEEVLIDNIGPYGASGAYFVMNEELQETLLRNPYVMICTDGSTTMRHPRGYGTFAKVIEEYVQEKQLLPLPEAIRKMTGLPAQTIGITDRGIIKAGAKADILIFDPAEIRENATYENPQQLASGFQFVILNGRIAKEGNKISDERVGQVLRKQTR